MRESVSLNSGSYEEALRIEFSSYEPIEDESSKCMWQGVSKVEVSQLRELMNVATMKIFHGDSDRLA